MYFHLESLYTTIARGLLNMLVINTKHSKGGSVIQLNQQYTATDEVGLNKLINALIFFMLSAIFVDKSLIHDM